MPVCPLGSKYCQTTSGKACHHHPWTTYKVRRRRALHVIIHFGLHLWSKHIERVMLSSSLDFTHGRTTSGMACPHVPWAANTVRRHRARHSIIALRKNMRLDDVVHGMLSLTLASTHGQTTSSVTFHHHRFYEKCLLTH